MANDLRNGDYASFYLNAVGLMIPGVTGLGLLSKTDDLYDGYRFINGADNIYERGVINGLPSGHVFDFPSFPKENLRPYKPKRLLVGQEASYSCVAASCRMILNNIKIQEESLFKALNMGNSGISIENAVAVLKNYKYVNDGPLYTSLIQGLERGPAIISVRTPYTNPNHAIVIDSMIEEAGAHWLNVRDPLPFKSGSAYSIKVSGDFWEKHWFRKGILILK
jgi:hypothetical protein